MMAKKLAILSLAIICMFIAYVLIPKREFLVQVFPLSATEKLMAYDDLSDGGSSKAKMELSDSVLDFRCTLGMDTSKGAWCGVIWQFNYENWSLVDSILLDVYSETETEIIAKVWTYDPDVTNKDSLTTFRQLLKEIPLKKGENHIAIPFQEFYVPDFWFQKNGVAKELMQRHKEHVSRFEVTPGWDVKRGEPMHFRFTKIAAKGTGSIELAIFLIACVVIVVIALGFLKKKK